MRTPDHAPLDGRAVVADLLDRLNASLAAEDAAAAAALFCDDCYWRDILSLTWTIRTAEGRGPIRRMLEACQPRERLSGLHIPAGEQVAQAGGVLECRIAFETVRTRGTGWIRVRDGRIWTLLTTSHELKGHEERQGRSRPDGLTKGVARNRVTWTQRIARERAELGHTRQPYVVIVGGGQGGIALAARLRQLDVPTLVLDRNARPGDSWRNRYRTLTLQDPVWYDHLPYLEFPRHWPVYSPKDKIGDWLEMYAGIMEIDYWGGTEVSSAARDEATGRWTIHATRDGRPVRLEAAHLVLATGMSGRPHVPQIPGMDSFRGDQHHSSRHPGPDAYAGKRAIVVGSNNSAHDIAQALWEMGAASVTLVQRSSTLVVKQGSLMEHGLKRLYSEEALEAGIGVERADLITASVPLALAPEFHRPTNAAIQRQDRPFYEALARVGFRVDWGEDGNRGVFALYLSRGAGYYIDIGASDLVIDGSIRLKSGVEITEITPEGMRFSDGSDLPADLIVHATGYAPMEGWVHELLGPEVAAKVGKLWGFGSGLRGDPGPWQGELRNMWKPTAQPGLWFHGGNLAQSRYYSSFLAQQLKARMEGIPVTVYEG